MLAGANEPGLAGRRGRAGGIGVLFSAHDIPAMWGWTAGHRLGMIAASTFGTTGSEWITGVGVGLAALGYYAVSLIAMAIKLIMLGLLPAALSTRGSSIPGVSGLWSCRAPSSC